MIFVSAEQSKAKATTKIFKKLYEDSHKAYPNWYMMLFIPLLDSHHHSTEFPSKVNFNHEQYISEEAAFSIGGFQDLKSQIQLKMELLKSIPGSAASAGISQPASFFNMWHPMCLVLWRG